MHHLGKIPNMASQWFTGGLFHKEVLLGRSSLGLPCDMTMVCASSTLNYGIMVPFLVEMCIFAFPTILETSVFFEGATKGSVQNITTLIIMGGGPTWGATSRSYGIISACCHIMYYFCPKSILIQFCTGAKRNAHPKNWGKILGGPLGVWDPRTKTKPWFPPHLADIDGTASLT
jgi:hypothetical protein